MTTAFIEELTAQCAQRGVSFILVPANHGDDPAIALYTQLVKREDVMRFDIMPFAPLSTPPPPHLPRCP